MNFIKALYYKLTRRLGYNAPTENAIARHLRIDEERALSNLRREFWEEQYRRDQQTIFSWPIEDFDSLDVAVGAIRQYRHRFTGLIYDAYGMLLSNPIDNVLWMPEYGRHLVSYAHPVGIALSELESSRLEHNTGRVLGYRHAEDYAGYYITDDLLNSLSGIQSTARDSSPSPRLHKVKKIVRNLPDWF